MVEDFVIKVGPMFKYLKVERCKRYLILVGLIKYLPIKKDV